ncbi:putative phosphoric monoester hydrolase [Helianthus anomalus]
MFALQNEKEPVACCATVVVAYLMKTHGMSSSKALNLVKSKRSVVAPNAGFILQLQSYEKSLPGIL